MKIARIFPLSLSLFCFALTACSHTSQDSHPDPYEKFNRTMWRINYNYLDPYVLRPVAVGWKNYVPSPLRTTLVNVANNLDEPASFANHLLAGEGKQAMIHFTRFWMNSIFGVGGIFNWADRIPNLHVASFSQRRFGDTLAKYGVKSGAYLMIPAYGPATPRQDLGNLVDYAYPVFSLLSFPAGLAKYVVQGVNKRANLLSSDATLKQSQDPYIMFREAYFQNMDYRLNEGKMPKNPEPHLSPSELNDID